MIQIGSIVLNTRYQSDEDALAEVFRSNPLFEQFQQPTSPPVHLSDIRLAETVALLGTTNVPVVVWGGHPQTSIVRSLQIQGAAGYVPLLARTSEIAQALHICASGGTYFPALETVEETSGSLTTAELRAVRAYADELFHLPRPEVAEQLGLAEGTLKVHLAAARRKLGPDAGKTRQSLRRFVLGGGLER